MSAKRVVRLTPSAEEAIAGAAVPALWQGSPVQTPKRNGPLPQSIEKRTDSISAGIRRIVEEEKRTERLGIAPSDRSHTDKETGEQKPEADDGGEALTGRSRLEKLIKDRRKSKSRRSEERKGSKKRAKRLAEANEEEPFDFKGSGEDEKFPTPEVKESTKESGTKESGKDSPPPKREKKASPSKKTRTTVHSTPTSSRSCVHVNYLAVYDRLVEEERKEFESKLRRKVTIRFGIIFVITILFFLTLTITFAVLHFGKPCKG